jgi:type IV pilus assembly protein PilY1
VKKPQVLLIFDNSGSMGTEMTVKKGYDPSINYPAVGSSHKFSDKFIYYAKGGVDGVNLPEADKPSETRRFLDAINSCETARNILATNGFYTGHIREYSFKGNSGSWNELPNNNGANITIIDCEDDVLNNININQGIDPKTGNQLPNGYPVDSLGTKQNPQYFIDTSKGNVEWAGELVTLYTDNYLRWYQAPDSSIGTEKKTRLEVAKESFTQVINSTPSVDFGLQVFNRNGGYRRNRHGNYYYHNNNNNGGRIISGIKSMTPVNKNDYLNTLNDLTADTWTPLCETLYEASRYFAGEEVLFGDDDPSFKPDRDTTVEVSGKYKTPFNGCGSKAFVIFMTDGVPSLDHEADNLIKGLSVVENGTTINFNGSPFSLKSGDTSYLPALAGWMNQHDISDKVEGKQIIETYTIGFSDGATDAAPLLTETAKLGGGKYFAAKNSQKLTAALINALQSLTPSNESLTSASIASNNFDNTQTLDFVYYAMFEPQSGPRWQGNVKKYKVINKEQYGSNGVAVIDTDGTFSDKVQSYWSLDVDGIDVASGGVADMLRKKTNRVLYSDLSSGTNLVNFNLTNAESAFGGATALATKMNIPEAELATYIDWAKGKNVDQVKLEDKSIPTMRPDVFADPLHSKPLVINYGSSIRILIGTNAGVLHMFEDKGNSVDETWAFMPKEFIPNISKLRNNFSSSSKVYGIDGKISSYIKDNNGDGIVNGSDKVWIFFGLRRGGEFLLCHGYYRPKLTQVNVA